MKYFLIIITAILPLAASASQPGGDVPPAKRITGNINRRNPRADFISFDIRTKAEDASREGSPYYIELDIQETMLGNRWQLLVNTEIPYMWLDRDVFLRIGGIPAYELYVNGRPVGSGTDSRVAGEFFISPYISDGANRFEIAVTGTAESMFEYDGGNSAPAAVVLFSQPKIRIDNFRISSVPDSTGHHGIFDLEVFLSNSYNTDEAITVGYDIYSPDGKLQFYDMAETVVPSNGTDTVCFRELIYNTGVRQWEAGSPNLYYGLITLRRNGRMTEYIPYKTGFGLTELKGNGILRNGRVLNIKAASYNSKPTEEATSADIEKIISEGYNTIIPDYPQPDWFYDICDREGVYVIDRANINYSERRQDRDIGGTPSNDPQWEKEYLSRVRTMYMRSRNHACIIAWCLGGDSGNGYNMYEAYRWLKEAEPDMPVIYNDAEGEWNSDLPPIQTADMRNI